MKKLLFSIMITVALLAGNQSYAQKGVAINNTGADPDNSAILDVSAANKGLLIPNVTLTGTTDAATILTPAVSLLVYNTATVSDVTPGYYYNSGTKDSPVWKRFETKVTAGANITVTGTGTTASPYVVGRAPGTTAGEIQYWNGSAWVNVALGANGQTLTYCHGVPTWGPCTPSEPDVSTTAITSITTTAASTGGNVTYDGESTVTVRGVCYNTSTNPTTANNPTPNGTGTGIFVSNLTGLTSNTTYYLKAYATNSTGTAYGAEVSFTTLAITLPTLAATTAATSITATSASSGGDVTYDGGATVTARGVCWSLTTGPIATDSHTTEDGTTGIFTSSLTGLTAGTTYYVRAYATNGGGTRYGTEVSFTTSAIEPTLDATTAASLITATTASSGGSVTSDGGATVTARGVCWSLTTGPVATGSHTVDAGTTGSYTSSLTGLTGGTTYYVRAYATNGAGTAYGSEISFTTPRPLTGTVNDIDGNTYNYVTIGTQTWMVENLKTTKYRNGDAIANVIDGATWGGLSSGAYCWYNGYGATYGALYNWYAVADSRNIAPTGWHVPTDAEWYTLTDYLGGLNAAGVKLKEAGTVHWRTPNTGASNSSGFTALPGGYRDDNGIFGYIGGYGYLWSSTEYSTLQAWTMYTGYDLSNAGIGYGRKVYGYSVRCLRD